MEEELNYTGEIRKGIIKGLMFTLYSNEEIIYREYVQNALDSINAAVKLHILDKVKDGIVEINIDHENRRIVIRDNGKGIRSSYAVRALLDISANNKDGITEAGQFGIGRLVGGGYCHEMVFTTSARGEDVATQVVFDVDKIWKMIDEDTEDYPATKVLNDGTTKQLIPAKVEEHFFEVQLNGVKEEFVSTLLNTKEISEYLSLVAPVEYKPPFVNALISGLKRNVEFESRHINLDKVQLFVNGSTRIQKQYGLTVESTGDDIDSLEYFKIEDPNYGELAWGWYGLTRYTVQIPKTDNLAGFRLRIHNIQIGDASLLARKPLWNEERASFYFYGEVFITHPNIRPNLARDGLAPSVETKALYAGLEIYFKELKSLYTKANAAKNAIGKIYEGIKLSETKGLDYPKAKDLIDNKGIGVFSKLDKSSDFKPISKMIELYKPDYNDALHAVYELRNKYKKITPPEPVLAEVPFTSPPVTATTETTSSQGTMVENTKTINIVKETASDKQDGTPSIPGFEPIVEETVEPKKSQLDHSETNVLPQTRVSDTPVDLIASLSGILDKSEMWIIRKIFRVLNENCPKNEHDQRLIEQLQMLIVKEFRNGK